MAPMMVIFSHLVVSYAAPNRGRGGGPGARRQGAEAGSRRQGSHGWVVLPLLSGNGGRFGWLARRHGWEEAAEGWGHRGVLGAAGGDRIQAGSGAVGGGGGGSEEWCGGEGETRERGARVGGWVGAPSRWWVWTRGMRRRTGSGGCRGRGREYSSLPFSSLLFSAQHHCLRPCRANQTKIS